MYKACWLSLKVYVFTKGNNFCEFLFASPDNKTLQTRSLLLIKRICSKLDRVKKGGKYENSRVVPPYREPLHFKVYGYTLITITLGREKALRVEKFCL